MAFKLTLTKILLGVFVWLAVSTQALAAISAPAFAQVYKPVAAVASIQSQVVYFRSGQPMEAGGAANIYVDKQFHTGLLPGGFTAFCVAPGNHSLLAFLDDAPGYTGKQREHPFALKGGETVFLRVNPGAGGLPQIVPRVDAERELLTNRRQAQVVSRAAAVQDCSYSPDRRDGIAQTLDR